MMESCRGRLVQVNVTAGRGSTGTIAEEIGAMARADGWDCWLAYGREPHRESQSRLLRIGSDTDMRLHGVQTRLLDNHGLASRQATRRFVAQLREINPDLIHLHNIHGYYLNYPILFDWLRQWGGPVVWTLHDCWPFTGHCPHFMFAGCDRWLGECRSCPLKRSYPASFLLDRSTRNFRRKREAFTSLGPNLTLVCCSKAVADYARQSFFAQTRIEQIYNGVDLNTFSPCAPKRPRSVLGVASVWPASKGLGEFMKLRQLLPSDWTITLVGLSPKQIASLPPGIEGIARTADAAELARLYSEATVFVNPTFEDNFPTVNIEALASGTPVITYRTGGSPEAIDPATGIVIGQGRVEELADAIVNRAPQIDPAACRARAMKLFDKNDRYREYIDLYNHLTAK